MNIIHLLSQNHLTGAEVYATSLSRQQLEQGHNLFQISNGFFAETKAVKFNLEVETNSKWQLLKNIFWFRNFLHKQNIHVVHSHSRAAAKLAFYSTLFTRVAHVSTVHGVQHPSLSKKLFNQYGQQQIAVCANIKDQLIQDFSYREKLIHVIGNPISKDLYSFKPKIFNFKDKIKIAIIGRSTGPKALRTAQCLKTLFSDKFKDFAIEVFIVGGELEQLDIDEATKKKVILLPPQPLNSDIYSQFDLIIGSGRVCIEALISGVPCLAFGEAQYVGLINSNNFLTAMQSNFGDIVRGQLEPQIDEEHFIDQLVTFFKSNASQTNELQKLSDLTLQYFNSQTVNSKVTRIYESAYFLKNFSRWIPVLMYHKIPEKVLSSKHKIFVTKSDFEKHLIFFKNRGFTTLTFSELALYRKGLLSFKSFPRKPLILTFDDGYQDNLDNASPLLKKFGFKAQIFLLADKNINSNQWDHSQDEPTHEIMAGSKRQKWKDSAFEIGSHGYSHQKLSELSDGLQLKELSNSRLDLENEFNQPINSYAFTYGITTPQARELAQNAGYDYAVNTDSGGLLIEEDPYAIFRVNMFPNENFWSLFKKTSSWYRKYYYFKRKK